MWATALRPSVAGWSGVMSASCTGGLINLPLSRAVGGRIMHCGIISSCQSAATSEIVKRCCSGV